ncbi:uncharacterized protein PRCAT00000784001 [Priceomyces carsonii]|uniref:uncharacterized protein n=1 Tax=Priceomyces carsonii TaxID=28549 RepID=UPI002ED9E4D1|nr:unnamed protein product [Priceomyces carsonii]
MAGSKDFDNQYRYDEMSNKVLRPGRRFKDNDEDTTPVSLAGHVSIQDMGTRVVSESVQRKTNSKKTSRSSANGTTFEGTFDNSSYHPTNEETSHIFNLIITELGKVLSDQSHEVIISAADSVLDVLKNDEISVAERRIEINKLLDMQIDDSLFEDLVGLSRRINDYGDQVANQESIEQDEENTVAVAFEDTDEEDGDIKESFDEAEVILPSEEAEVVPEVDTKGYNDEVILKLNEKKNEEKLPSIPLHTIDRYYIQREISKILPDKDQKEIHKVAERISKALKNYEMTKRELEDEIMDALDYEHFSFVQVCMENRWRLSFKLKIIDADNDESLKKALYDDMKKLGLYDLFSEMTLGGEHNIPVKRKLSSSDDKENDFNKRLKSDLKERMPRVVDLNNYAFDQGSHLMSVSKVKLPQGSYQQNKKLYDIISIPAPQPAPLAKDEISIKITELPEWAQPIFPSNETLTLNRIQSKIYPSAFKTDENLLLCAPTGAGKTNVAMLTVLRVINNFRDSATGKIDIHNFKIVYVAPLKALVQEQVREFQRRLTPTFGIVVNELTGDSSLTKQQMNETQILVTTPEKWDVVTRKPNPYTELVKLIIIDEIHLLHDERGPVIESIVSRTLRQMRPSDDLVRLVGLSATLPNYEDVAKFLRVDSKKGLYYFDSTFRPCPLAQQFIGIKERKAIKRVNAMNEACYDKLIDNLKDNYQIIIFVHSRKDTFKTAKWLSERLTQDEKSLNLSSGTNEILKQEAEIVDNRGLKEIIGQGFGIHHAGLKKDERNLVEDLFAQGHLRVLVSTATLAWGVNLPAHTVIIKGTDTYSPEKGDWIQLSPQDILQMLGRAGRPRYDKNGEGIIITSQDEIQYYLAILNQQLPIESQFINDLPDALNAEIVLGSIESREDAIKWLGYTYLYIRMLKSPKLYRVGLEYSDDDDLYWKRMDLVHSALLILHQNMLIQYDSETGKLKSMELGKIASRFYINYETVNMFNNQLKPWSSEIDILKVFSQAGEFRFIPIRQEEKLEVQKLSERCPIPIKDNPSSPLAKVNALLQTYISRLSLDGFALMSDMIYITQSAGRLLRAIYQIVLKKNWSSVTKTALDLCKIVEKRMWLSNSPFRQFGDLVPTEVIRTTESSLLPFLNYFDLSAEELAESVNLRANSQIAFNLLKQFPRLSLSYYAQPITPNLIRVQVEVLPEWTWNPKIHGNFQTFLVIVEDCDGEKILQTGDLTVSRKHAQKEHLLDFTLPVMEPLQPNYFVTFISDKWLHSEWTVPVMLSNLTFPKRIPTYDALLDLESVPTSDLNSPDLIQTFPFNYFNKFQTQVFPSLFKSNENIFIGISKGGGKTVCAELAILNHWMQNKGRIVYINPSQENIDELCVNWKKYQHLPNKTINKLTNNLSKNIRLLSTSHLILATPQQFDMVSRRWKQRRSIQAIELFIMDDCHSVGNALDGYVYESIISRMRFISTQVDTSIRFVALSTPLFNCKDFADWLGCSKSNTYNFDPASRFNRIEEIRLQPYSGSPSEIASLPNDPSYMFLKENMDSSSLIFLPTRKDCIEAAISYVELSRAEDWDMLKVHPSKLDPYVKKVKDKELKYSLEYGIGLYYVGMDSRDKLIVEQLFASNTISCLLAAKGTCQFAPFANNVVILGTREFDGKEQRFVDFTIADILEMIGCCKDNLNNASKILVLTTASKISYYNKFLVEGLPIESHLNLFIHDCFMNEISSKVFESRQDCIDWITFSYFYRRLQSNPSFYDVKDTSHLGVSEYLSELVESTLKDLEDSALIETEVNDEDQQGDAEDEEEDEEEEDSINPLNGAMIASYYNTTYDTMKELQKIDNKTRLKGILEAITSASELELVPIRQNEESILSKLYSKVPIKVTEPDYESPQFKALVLLQAHFSRLQLPVDLVLDQKAILQRILNVLYASIDTLSGEGYLNAIHAMDLSQMIIQAVWNKDSPLKQIPNFDNEILSRCSKAKIDTVYDLMAMEDEERDDVLRLQGEKLNDVAEFVNKYPNIDITYELDLSSPISSNDSKQLKVVLERDEEMEDDSVIAPYYPFPKDESWWIVLGDADSRQLYAIKKTTINKELQAITLEFTIPNPGHHKLSIWCVCDSYVDADKEVSFEIDVVPGSDSDEDDDDDDDGDEEEEK